MVGGGRIHLLLQHPLVNGGDRPLGATVDPGVQLSGSAERVLGDRTAGVPRDSLHPVGDLLGGPRVALPSLGRTVCVVNRHPHDRDGVVNAGHRRHPWQATAGPDDHLAVQLLAQDPVRGANVVGILGGDGRGLQPKTRLAHRGRRIDHHLIRGCAAIVEGEVEAL